MNFAKIAKELREEKGLSQMQLSKFLGISAAAIGFLELGKHEPNSATIIAYSKFFGVSADFLLELENDYGAKNYSNSTVIYSSEERKFIEDLRKLPQGMRDILRTTLNAMINDYKKDTIG